MIYQEQYNGPGFVTVQPGVYNVVKSGGAGQQSGVPRGVLLCISGTEFTRLKPATPFYATSKEALKAYLPEWGAQHGNAIFKPFKDPLVPGGASLVCLVNAAPSTRSSLALTKSGTTQITLKSRFYGAAANKLWATVGSGTTKGKKYTVGFEGTSYVLDNVGGDNVFGAKYTGSDASAVTLAVDPTSGVTIRQTVNDALTSGDDDWDAPSELAWDGAATLTLNAANGAGITFTITGTNKATGLADTEAVAFASGDTTKTTTKTWSAVSNIARTSGSWTSAANADVAVDAVSCPIASFDTIADVIDAINAKSAATYVATDALGDSASRLVSTLDGASATSIVGSSYVYFKADADAAYQSIGNDEADTPTDNGLWTSWIIAEKGTTITGAPDNVTSPTYFQGGANGTADSDSWQDALDCTREVDINEGWADTTDSGIEALILAHVDYQNGRGGRPMDWHFHTSSQPSKATVAAKAIVCNRETAQLWVNAIRVRDANGKPVWRSPAYLALRIAAGYCGTTTPVMPLLHKELDVEDVRHGSDWTFSADGEELLRSSAALVSKKPGGGFWVVDDITTYRRAKDPIYSAGSAVRSIQISTWDLKLTLDAQIGQPGFAGTAAALLELAKDRLKRQRDEFGYNNGYANLTVESIGGSSFRVNTSLYPVLPVKYVENNITALVPTSIIVTA